MAATLLIAAHGTVSPGWLRHHAAGSPPRSAPRALRGIAVDLCFLDVADAAAAGRARRRRPVATVVVPLLLSHRLPRHADIPRVASPAARTSGVRPAPRP